MMYGAIGVKAFVMGHLLFGLAATSPRPRPVFRQAAARSGAQAWPQVRAACYLEEKGAAL